MHKDAPDKIRLGALLCVCLAVLLYGCFLSENFERDFAYLLGCNIPLALLVWGIFQLVFGRKKGMKAAAAAFSAILVSLLAGGLISYAQQKKAAREALATIQRDYSGMLRRLETSHTPPAKPIDERLDPAQTTRGDFEELERFMKTSMNKAESVADEYRIELEAIGRNVAWRLPIAGCRV